MDMLKVKALRSVEKQRVDLLTLLSNTTEIQTKRKMISKRDEARKYFKFAASLNKMYGGLRSTLMHPSNFRQHRTIINDRVKVKASIPITGLWGPRGFWEVKVSRFRDIGT
jgi:hypothetical protein